MINKKNGDKKKIIKAIKYAFKKMQNNDEMSFEFIEFLKKWGCIDV